MISDLKRISDLNVRLSDIGNNRLDLAFAGSKAVCEELKDRFEVNEVVKFRVDMSLSTEVKSFLLEVRIFAKVIQNCVITLNPVAQKIDINFKRHYKSALNENKRVKHDKEALLCGDNGDFEIIERNILNIERVVIEALSLEIDLYPRSNGATLGSMLEDSRDNESVDQSRQKNPFHALSKLKRG